MTDLTASLAPSDYVSDDVYRREVADIFERHWLPVCRVDQLDVPGARYAVDLAGRPLVAVRGDASIRVFANVCPHRGSTIVEPGQGRGSALVCPYHRWSFRLDGSLVGAPLAEGLDLDGVCLPEVRHTVWEGFVLVALSGEADEPHDALAGLSSAIAPWRWSEMVTVASRRFESTWNWKVMVENWIECYHHVGAHRETVEPFQPARNTRLIDSGGAPWAAMTVDSIDGVEGPPDEWMPGIEPSMAKDLSVWSAFPLLLGGGVSRYGFWLQIEPMSTVRHAVTWHLVTHPDQLDRFTTEAAEATMEMLAEVHREDIQSCERVHAGLASGLLDRFTLAPLEATVADFQRWVRAAMSPAAD
ncbi:MAG: aromatic ring-hydroxylating dioxygenase subunit alpha [Ilumatobacter sp.]|nr:aromatic ring-hydroxylating dioxygenase subunit alpha [Ilumatobacter sp.]